LIGPCFFQHFKHMSMVDWVVNSIYVSHFNHVPDNFLKQ
jgi:hypothetical protein